MKITLFLILVFKVLCRIKKIIFKRATYFQHGLLFDYELQVKIVLIKSYFLTANQYKK